MNIGKGFIVYSIDHVAHGMSEGTDILKTKGLIEDYNILVNDFQELAKIAREENFSSESLPISIISHSMGTLVAMLAWKEIPGVNCIVYSGTPLFSGHSASSPFGIKMLYPLSQSSLALRLASVLSTLDPKGK
jgi:alpha-beta hydrolase superfamily lysophospholipase